MWIIPSFGRPDAIKTLRHAPGGMPNDVIVVINDDDPCRDDYLCNSPWPVLVAPSGSRHTDAINFAFAKNPKASCYGLFDDDYWPLTPNWWEPMERAAGDTAIALANNRINFPRMLAARCMGGGLARAVGALAPGPMRQNYSDNTWQIIADDFGLLRPLADVVIEHHHPVLGTAIKSDATYERGSVDIDEDRVRFEGWLASPERRAMNERIRTLLAASAVVRGGALADRRIEIALMAYSAPDRAVEEMLSGLPAAAAAFGWSVEVKRYAENCILPAMRNTALANFRCGDASDLIMIDADNGCSPSDLLRLVRFDADIVGAAVRSRVPALAWNVRWLSERPELVAINLLTGQPAEDGVIEIEGIGTGLMRISRDCIERMVEAAPDDWYYDLWSRSGKSHALFEYERKDHLWHGEDLVFCRRAREAGCHVYLDPTIKTFHVGRVAYEGGIGTWLRGNRGDDNAPVEVDIEALTTMMQSVDKLKDGMKTMRGIVDAHVANRASGPAEADAKLSRSAA